MPRGYKDDLSSGFKTCPSCKRRLELAAYTPARNKPNGIQSYCRECMRDRFRDWVLKNPHYSADAHREGRKKDPERYRDYDRKKWTGAPFGTFKQLYAAQDGKCAICRCDDPKKAGKKGFHIDHCHDTKRIRGLLCQSCNLGIGQLRHSVDILKSAIIYLESSLPEGG